MLHHLIPAAVNMFFCVLDAAWKKAVVDEHL
jgi:hypothetical protein